MRNRISVLIVLVLATSSCKSTSARIDTASASLGPIASISMADEKPSVIAKLGPPQSQSSEKFPSAQYDVLEYSSNSGIPAGYISLEPGSSRVAGRSIWISEGQPEQEFRYLQEKLFPHAEFQTFVSCDKYHADAVKVDQKLGLFIKLHKENVVLVSWSDARLTKLRIDQFSLKCPERQKGGWP